MAIALKDAKMFIDVKKTIVDMAGEMKIHRQYTLDRHDSDQAWIIQFRDVINGGPRVEVSKVHDDMYGFNLMDSFQFAYELLQAIGRSHTTYGYEVK